MDGSSFLLKALKTGAQDEVYWQVLCGILIQRQLIGVAVVRSPCFQLLERVARYCVAPALAQYRQHLWGAGN